MLPHSFHTLITERKNMYKITEQKKYKITDQYAKSQNRKKIPKKVRHIKLEILQYFN